MCDISCLVLLDHPLFSAEEGARVQGQSPYYCYYNYCTNPYYTFPPAKNYLRQIGVEEITLKGLLSAVNGTRSRKCMYFLREVGGFNKI